MHVSKDSMGWMKKIWEAKTGPNPTGLYFSDYTNTHGCSTTRTLIL